MEILKINFPFACVHSAHLFTKRESFAPYLFIIVQDDVWLKTVKVVPGGFIWAWFLSFHFTSK